MVKFTCMANHVMLVMANVACPKHAFWVKFDQSRNFCNFCSYAGLISPLSCYIIMEPPKPTTSNQNGLGKRATKLNMLFEKYVERIIQSIRYVILSQLLQLLLFECPDI
jgi:hypothetical protein